MNNENSKLNELAKTMGWTTEDVEIFVGEIASEITRWMKPRQDDTKDNKPSIDERIAVIFTKMGTPFSLKGSMYAREAVKQVFWNENMINAVIRDLYPTIAEQFDTMPNRVERGIRHAIEVTWQRGDWQVIEEIFGNTTNSNKSKPTNSEFIALLANYLRLERDLK